MSAVIRDRAGRSRALARVYLRRRYAILFYTLLLIMVVSPLVAAFDLPGALIEMLLAANMLAAVMPVNAGPKRRVLLAAMAFVWLARLTTAWFEHPLISAMTLGVWTLIGLIAAATALRFAMRATQVVRSIHTRRSAPIFWQEFSSVFFIGPSSNRVWAHSAPPAIFLA